MSKEKELESKIRELKATNAHLLDSNDNLIKMNDSLEHAQKIWKISAGFLFFVWLLKEFRFIGGPF